MSRCVVFMMVILGEERDVLSTQWVGSGSPTGNIRLYLSLLGI